MTASDVLALIRAFMCVNLHYCLVGIMMRNFTLNCHSRIDLVQQSPEDCNHVVSNQVFQG